MTNQDSEKEKKQRIGYGVRLPILTLEQSVSAVKDSARLGGESGSLDVFATVFQNSRSSSTFFYKLAVLKNFGLITYDKLNYQLTDLGRRIVKPESMTDEYKAIHGAFCENEILAKVWENYKGKLLPVQEYVANFIEKSCEIPSNLKQQWADYFVGSAQFSQIIVERGGSIHVLYEPQVTPGKSEETKPLMEVPQGKIITASIREHVSTVDSVDSLEWGNISKPKLSNGRNAIFAIPDELSEQDIGKLRVIIKGIEAGLDGLKKQD